jgi:hypothetical protein
MARCVHAPAAHAAAVHGSVSDAQSPSVVHVVPPPPPPPSGVCTQPLAGSQVSTVVGSASSHVGATPTVQMPPTHSRCVAQIASGQSAFERQQPAIDVWKQPNPAMH